MDVTQVTVNIPTEEYEALKKFAKEGNISVTQALRQAIAQITFLSDRVKAGSKVIVRDPSAQIEQQLIFAGAGQYGRR